MATSLSTFNVLLRPCPTLKARKSLQLKAQSYGDKGKSANIVDANMSILNQRIAELKMHERLQRYCRAGEGWNYQPGYDYKLQRDTQIHENLKIASLAAGTLGCTFLSGTLCLYLVSLLVHMSH